MNTTLRKTRTGRLLPVLLSLSLLSTLTSCLRTDTYDIAETPPPGPISGTRLAGIVIRDTSLSATTDSAELVLFTYDAQGRVIEVSAQNRVNRSDSTNLKFFYTGSDTLASKIIRYDRHDAGFGNEEQFDTLWRQYSAGVLQTDSNSYRSTGGQFPFTGQNVHRMVYSGTRIFDYAYSWIGSGNNNATDTLVHGVVHYPTRSNGLITAQVDSIATLNLRTGVLTSSTEQSRFANTYDSRPDPMRAVTRSISYPYVQLEYFAEVFETDYSAPLLPLNGSQTFSGYGPDALAKTENTHTFGADGRVLKRRFRTYLQGDWSEVQYTYFYQ